jgi:hypothetical protein
MSMHIIFEIAVVFKNLCVSIAIPIELLFKCMLVNDRSLNNVQHFLGAVMLLSLMMKIFIGKA